MRTFLRHRAIVALWMITAVFAILLTAIPARALDVPPLKGRVNDYAGMLSSSARDTLNRMLAGFEQHESTQIVVLTLPSLKGDSLDGFSIRVAEKWKIGQSGKDNGAILLISRDDRKVRIEVGYGLEGRLTDLVSGRIIRNIIVPEFRRGNFDQGVMNGVTAIMAVVKGEFHAQPSTPGKRGAPVRSRQSWNLLMVAVIFLVPVLSAIGTFSRKLAYGIGTVAAPTLAGTFLGTGFLGALGFAPAGLIGTWVLLSLLTGGGGRGGRGGGMGGGFWGGYYGGGGGFSSGGFGGFSGGGGGFGGGGASGSW